MRDEQVCSVVHQMCPSWQKERNAREREQETSVSLQLSRNSQQKKSSTTTYPVKITEHIGIDGDSVSADTKATTSDATFAPLASCYRTTNVKLFRRTRTTLELTIDDAPTGFRRQRQCMVYPSFWSPWSGTICPTSQTMCST